MPDTSAANTISTWDLLWRVRQSALYHLKRERFLDGVDKVSKLVSALGGAAAFSQIKGEGDFGLWITGVITVVATMSLDYGPSAKARKHAELARDFKRLEADVVRAGKLSSETEMAKFDAQYLTLESTEPASLGALVTQCHNELCEAYGIRDKITPLRVRDRLFKNWFDIDQTMPREKHGATG